MKFKEKLTERRKKNVLCFHGRNPTNKQLEKENFKKENF